MIKVVIGSNTYLLAGELEASFQKYRENVIGYNQYFMSPYGKKKMVYADWTASGRLYRPIEEKITNDCGPLIGNTHTESNITGTTMTKAYKAAKEIIRKHVNADKNDILIMDGSGMTSIVNKLARLLGIKVPKNLSHHIDLNEEDRPIIFVSHMEHHSNYLTWMETVADVVCIEPSRNGEINVEELEQLLMKYNHRKLKIGSFTACSNVTGIMIPYHKIAKKMHEFNGYCFIDFSASAPYVDINMHPNDPAEKLDAVMFSPHKFLGGPGTCGVLIMDQSLLKNETPDNPGGGTVLWTNPWGDYMYSPNREDREDGGTPGFLQAIKTALCIKLKENMGINKMLEREKELVQLLMSELERIEGVHLFEPERWDRLGIISFYVDEIHHHLFVKLLNDRFGIQARGGCSCAGPYGHYLLEISKEKSKTIADNITKGDVFNKPGWIRISVHPIMTNAEMYQIIHAIKLIIANSSEWKLDYSYDPEKDDFIHFSNPKFCLEQLYEFD
ncbi:aminotransferase class V-fold PLP-dependent enzyme [Litchfieldia salsa]|uniref:Selenocysteine lyase/Cysteine desulfurase n=1 Tax=Litchfieldia salsa TaxID=930152 RepID=A0A1H0WMQ7_9BACI|nr:aminotransferase class V-fold PLP-dependent enzyme [Litchfieldia salsa]SDP91927.1 Selenocysteine lyase/Cysteine desulfurase [Litchfieldia salsa]